MTSKFGGLPAEPEQPCLNETLDRRVFPLDAVYGGAAVPALAPGLYSRLETRRTNGTNLRRVFGDEFRHVLHFLRICHICVIAGLRPGGDSDDGPRLPG